MADTKIEVEVDLTNIRYRIEVDESDVEHGLKKLKVFIAKNDERLQRMASEALEKKQKNAAKLSSIEPIDCRLPDWFYKSNLSLAEAIALLMYFINKPLNTRQLTDVVNRELKGKRKDLRNVSKHLTSKGKSLFGYTSYDKVTQTYVLNEYGKRWVEIKFLVKTENPEE